MNEAIWCPSPVEIARGMRDLPGITEEEAKVLEARWLAEIQVAQKEVIEGRNQPLTAQDLVDVWPQVRRALTGWPKSVGNAMGKTAAGLWRAEVPPRPLRRTRRIALATVLCALRGL